MGSSGDGEVRRCELRRQGVQEMGSSGDEEFMRWGVYEMGSLGDGEFMRWGIQEMGVQELSYQGVTRAVFCVAKAQDTKHAAKQRVSDLYILNVDLQVYTCVFLDVYSFTKTSNRHVVRSTEEEFPGFGKIHVHVQVLVHLLTVNQSNILIDKEFQEEARGCLISFD